MKPVPLFLALFLVCAGPLLAQEAAATSALDRGLRAFEALDFDGARTALLEALTTKEPSLPVDGRIKANSLLAQIADMKREPDEALRRRQLALEGMETLHGKAAPALIPALEQLARARQRRGRRAEALATLERALTIFDAQEEARRDATQSRSLVFACARLADRLGKRPRALDAYRRYLRELEASVGKDQGELAYPVEQVARLLAATGETAEALAMQRRWIALYEKTKGKDDPTICRGLERTSSLALTLGLHDEALVDVERWLSILRRVTADHPEIARAERRAAKIERARGKPAAAAERLDRALALIHKIRGTGSLAAAATQRERAAVLRAQGKLEEAATAIVTSVKIYEKKRSAQDIELLDAVLERARVALARGEGKAAERDLRRIIRTWEKLAGKNHPVLRDPLELLAAHLEKKGGAEPELAALRTRLKALVKKSPGDSR